MIRVAPRRSSAPFVCSLASVALCAASGAAWADCDTLPPSFVSVGLNRTALNTTAGPDTVKCTMQWTDNLSGVDTASCTIAAPTPSGTYQQQFASCSATVPSSGTRLNGTFACDITLPRYSQSGTWTLLSVSAQDLVGNTGTGFPPPTTLTVTSNQDIVAPSITAFSFTPTSVNVTAAGANVTCNVTVTDALSGVNFVNCAFGADTATPTGDQHAMACNASAPSTGTRNNGTWSCVVPVPRYAQSGNWTASVLAFDYLGNFTSTLPPPPPPKLVVTSTPDVTEPNLTAFSFTPASIDPQTGAKTVECTMTFTDSPTGVVQPGCSFTAPFPAFGVSEGCTSNAPTSGTPQSGTWKCTVVIPQYAPGGQWAAGVTATDFANATAGAYGGNDLDLDSIALAGRGFPSLLTVACAGGGPAEANLRWLSDKVTLVWDPIAGAIKYNTYRGLTSQLVDADDNGLADNGYGACQTDSNPTDTQFVDTTKPARGTSYYYLVAYVKTFLEEGLGKSSSGLDRFPTTPCP